VGKSFNDPVRPPLQSGSIPDTPTMRLQARFPLRVGAEPRKVLQALHVTRPIRARLVKSFARGVSYQISLTKFL